MRDLEYINCNLCGEDNFKIIYSHNEKKIVKCKNCGLFYRNPRLRENINREFYSYKYYEEIFSARINIFKNILNRLQKETVTGTRNLLDVGCGQGHFLKLAKDLGWQVEGVELAQSACRFARDRFGIEIKNKDLKGADFPEDYFDAITLLNVLDHLLDPLGTLKEIYRILKPKGILVIRVRNINFHLFAYRIFLPFSYLIKNKALLDPFFDHNYWFSRKSTEKIFQIDPCVDHNYGFSEKTTKKILQKEEFRKIKIYNSLLSISNHCKSFKIFNEYLVNIFKRTYFIFSQLIYLSSFGRHTIGSSLLVWARK